MSNRRLCWTKNEILQQQQQQLQNEKKTKKKIACAHSLVRKENNKSRFFKSSRSKNSALVFHASERIQREYVFEFLFFKKNKEEKDRSSWCANTKKRMYAMSELWMWMTWMSVKHIEHVQKSMHSINSICGSKLASNGHPQQQQQQ